MGSDLCMLGTVQRAHLVRWAADNVAKLGARRLTPITSSCFKVDPDYTVCDGFSHGRAGFRGSPAAGLR